MIPVWIDGCQDVNGQIDTDADRRMPGPGAAIMMAAPKERGSPQCGRDVPADVWIRKAPKAHHDASSGQTMVHRPKRSLPSPAISQEWAQRAKSRCRSYACPMLAKTCVDGL